MQSLEKTARLKPLPVHSLPALEVGDGNPFKRFAAAGMPLILILAWGIMSFASRATNDISGAQQKREKSDAQFVAAQVFGKVASAPISADRLQFSSQSAFSVRRKSVISEWNVTYNVSPTRQYIMRINAATRQIYAVNTLQAAPVSLAIARPATAETGTLSPLQARQQADRYLKAFGVTNARLVSAPGAEGLFNGLSGISQDGMYPFTYRQPIPGVGQRLIKIAVDCKSGELAYFWNPSGVR